jgi:hypothetical protein
MSLFIGVLPQFAGQGISALAETAEEAEELVRDLYLQERDSMVHLQGTGFDTMTWERAKEYFGFHSNSVEVGRAYFDETPGE